MFYHSAFLVFLTSHHITYSTCNCVMYMKLKQLLYNGVIVFCSFSCFKRNPEQSKIKQRFAQVRKMILVHNRTTVTCSTRNENVLSFVQSRTDSGVRTDQLVDPSQLWPIRMDAAFAHVIQQLPRDLRQDLLCECHTTQSRPKPERNERQEVISWFR